MSAAARQAAVTVINVVVMAATVVGSLAAALYTGHHVARTSDTGIYLIACAALFGCLAVNTPLSLAGDWIAGRIAPDAPANH
jgi:hypothetical protein